ncbi:MAG TPA: hypothetical protein VKK31_21990 [Thermoanaerobaculia bacterium]|nr:hypothetical protein [Thermoanaerobaculia bacterium]
MMLETLERSAPPPPAGIEPPAGAGRAERTAAVLRPWLRAQSLNVTRHAAALRPFRRDEFGAGAEAPTESHVRAANELISTLRRDLFRRTRRVQGAVEEALAEPVTPRLQRVLTQKEQAHDQVRAIEQVWDFYFELFGQRQSQFGDWLLSCDRIALDCYQYAYLGLGKARSIPAPPPFSYMRTGFSPATYRRGIPLRRLGRQLNPFPLIQLPYHRLVNPWTLGAILHEVCHNLQNDLGLAKAVPRAIARRLLEAGLGRSVAAVWTRWNREIFADMGGLLLGGPAVVGSLMDVVGRGPAATLAYAPRAPHPTPYLRTFLSVELLRRMGFPEEAEGYGRAWSRLYPDPRGSSIPEPVLATWPRAVALVVDAICYRPYPSLGGKRLSEVIRFERKEQQMIEEAARRVAAGNDPGIIPERFMIGAARFALDNRLGRPGAIAKNFYRELARR